MMDKLLAYAQNSDLYTEPGFAAKTSRWTVSMTDRGEYVDVIDLRTESADREFKICPHLEQNELICGGVTRSHFLIDTLETVLLFTLEKKKLNEKIIKKHKCFINYIEAASPEYKDLDKIAFLLKNGDVVQRIIDRLTEMKAKAKDKITFLIADTFVVESDKWHGWWRNYRESIKSKDKNKNKMFCVLTGEKAIPAMTHPKVGISRIGGQPSGSVLVGFDKEAFSSYGLTKSKNAAMSEKTSTTYVNALTELLKYGQYISNTVLLYWLKKTVADDDNPFLIFSDDQSDKIASIEKLKRLIISVKSGEKPELIHNEYYLMILSGSGGRVMLRHWAEDRLTELIDNIYSWFNDLSITTPDSKGYMDSPKMQAVLKSMILKDLKEVPPDLITKMWLAAYRGQAIPRAAAAMVLKRTMSEIVSNSEKYFAVKMGLLKAYLLRYGKLHGGDYVNIKSELNTDIVNPVYHAGRLLAVLADLQQRALGNINAGVVQRYYSAASTTPRLVIGRLLKTSQHHLGKLESGLAHWYDNRIADVVKKINDKLPITLSLEEQSLFALGYYHQKAYSNREKMENRSKKEEVKE